MPSRRTAIATTLFLTRTYQVRVEYLRGSETFAVEALDRSALRVLLPQQVPRSFRRRCCRDLEGKRAAVIMTGEAFDPADLSCCFRRGGNLENTR